MWLIFAQVDGAIFVSGQIGMLPANLALPSPPSLAEEVALASQHTGRIVRALESGTGGGWEGIPMLNVFWYADVADALAVRGCVVSARAYLKCLPLTFM